MLTKVKFHLLCTGDNVALAWNLKDWNDLKDILCPMFWLRVKTNIYQKQLSPILWIRVKTSINVHFNAQLTIVVKCIYLRSKKSSSEI